MTTPNNQPTPPPGMEILTDYTQVLPKGAVFHTHVRWAPIEEDDVGCIPIKHLIYAIPITVPATGDAALKFLEENGFKIIRSAPVAGDALSIAIESEFGLSLDVYPSGVHVIVIAKGPDKGVYEYEDTEDILHILKAGTGDTTNEKGGEQRPDIEARNRIASISVEDDPMADNLAIALASYFSSHPGRPEDDSEHDDNYHWGDWVLEKTNAALDLIVKYTRK